MRFLRGRLGAVMLAAALMFNATGCIVIIAEGHPDAVREIHEAVEEMEQECHEE